jgi:hypothetical protein
LRWLKGRLLRNCLYAEERAIFYGWAQIWIPSSTTSFLRTTKGNTSSLGTAAWEFIDGETVEELVKRDGPLNCLPACALIAAEKRHLVHRGLAAAIWKAFYEYARYEFRAGQRHSCGGL